MNPNEQSSWFQLVTDWCNRYTQVANVKELKTNLNSQNPVFQLSNFCSCFLLKSFQPTIVFTWIFWASNLGRLQLAFVNRTATDAERMNEWNTCLFTFPFFLKMQTYIFRYIHTHIDTARPHTNLVKNGRLCGTRTQYHIEKPHTGIVVLAVPLHTHRVDRHSLQARPDRTKNK